MKITITKNEDGTVDVFCKRTMRGEGPSRGAVGVEQGNVPAVVAKLAAEIRGEVPVEGVQLSF